MSQLHATTISVPMNAGPADFARQLYEQAFLPMLNAYVGTQPDPLDAFVSALCSMSGSLAGSLAAVTSPEYAAGLLRAAADSCAALSNEPTPHPAPESDCTH